MKVILLEKVKTLGNKNDIIEVNDGYARNVLFRKKLAVEATTQNLNNLKLKLKNEDKVAKERLDDAKELAKKIEESSLKLTLKVGDGDRAFGSISSKEIAEACSSQLNLEVDKKKIVLDTPIKALGRFEVQIKLHPEVTANLVIVVDRE